MAVYAQVSLGELKDQLTQKLGRNSTFWVGDEKRFALNEALKVWQAMTGEFTTSFILTPSDLSVAVHNVPRQIVATQRILHDGVPLSLISLWELDQTFSNWQTAPTLSAPQFWAPIGFNMVAIYPRLTGVLTYEGIAETPKLHGDGDYISLGEEEMTRIIDYAHHYCTFKEGSGEQEASAPGIKKFIEAAVLRNARLRASTWYRIFMGLPRDEDQKAPRRAGGIGRN